MAPPPNTITHLDDKYNMMLIFGRPQQARSRKWCATDRRELRQVPPGMHGKVMQARFEGAGVLFYALDNDDAERMRRVRLYSDDR